MRRELATKHTARQRARPTSKPIHTNAPRVFVSAGLQNHPPRIYPERTKGTTDGAPFQTRIHPVLGTSAMIERSVLAVNSTHKYIPESRHVVECYAVCTTKTQLGAKEHR